MVRVIGRTHGSVHIVLFTLEAYIGNHIYSSKGVDMEENELYPKISVLIPTRNEAQNLQFVLPHIPSIVGEVILVDGNSTDDTVVVAQQLYPAIHVIQQEGKGKGDALRLGVAASTGKIIVTLDADGSACPDEIPRFVDALMQGYDFAKGSRFLPNGGSDDITWLRRLGNFWLCKLANTLFGTRFTDLCYGYNAFWKYCFEQVYIECDGFEVEALINLRMYKCQMRTIEVPSFEYPRRYGRSNLRTFRDGWHVLRTIMRERSTKTIPLPQPYHTVPLWIAEQPTSPRRKVIL
jgi:glycosyltransferase involved in cell wall biosynthesis